MTRLSAIIIAKDEERDLPGCLDSLRGLADEVVVVDSGSVDATRELARRAGARVFERAWDGFGPQKQYALEQAAGEWVLNLDADERVTPALARELPAALSGPFAGFEVPYENYFLGRRLRFGGRFAERHLRLFRREQARYGADRVHEGVRVDGPVGRLSGGIRHESYRDLDEYLDKCRRYTGLIAERKYAAGARFRFWHHLRLPWEFLLRYVLKLGFLDGNAGLVHALLSAYYAWLKHARLLDGGRRPAP